MTTDAEAGAPIRVGISSCLLGEEVRFDGGRPETRGPDRRKKVIAPGEYPP